MEIVNDESVVNHSDISIDNEAPLSSIHDLLISTSNNPNIDEPYEPTQVEPIESINKDI